MRRRTDRTERAVARVAALARAPMDVARFAEGLVDEIAGFVPHAASCVVTLDPESGLLTGTYKFGLLAGFHEQDELWAQLEYGSDDPTRMEVIAARRPPAMSTSQLPGGPLGSIRFRTLVRPAGYGDELRMVALHDGRAWGGVNLFRKAEEHPFRADEVTLVSALSATVAGGLRRGLTAGAASSIGATAAGPAVLVVGADASIRQVSVGATALLEELTDGSHRSPADSVLQSLVAAAHRGGHEGSPTSYRTRVRTASGRWLVARVTPLTDGDRQSGEVVITIDEARPPDVVSLITSVFGLTARERDVAELVLCGTDTRGIATGLSMSPHTVQDHLKSIFDKVGVRSRRELLRRVFFEQHAPR